MKEYLKEYLKYYLEEIYQDELEPDEELEQLKFSGLKSNKFPKRLDDGRVVNKKCKDDVDN